MPRLTGLELAKMSLVNIGEAIEIVRGMSVEYRQSIATRGLTLYKKSINLAKYQPFYSLFV